MRAREKASYQILRQRLQDITPHGLVDLRVQVTKAHKASSPRIFEPQETTKAPFVHAVACLATGVHLHAKRNESRERDQSSDIFSIARVILTCPPQYRG